ncbi:MAG: tail fiber domain-containing protein [Ignavibacteriae bacterium]|nr:tail fiber domain-containing protein [Ignavibacteriota bacterium]NOG99552.1 tail fiber domain-containing protein [Ignavibacteriota bacterium]
MQTKSVLIFFCLIFISSLSYSQNVDIKLAGDDSTKAFFIISDAGDTLFTIRGDGVVSFSNSSSAEPLSIKENVQINSINYLLNIDGKNNMDGWGDGRDIKLDSGDDIIFEGAIGFEQVGGSITIFGGDYEEFHSPGGIDIIGGSHDDGIGGGEIKIYPGDNADLNLFGGGYGSSGGNYGGDVNIKASAGGYAGDVYIESGIGDAGEDAGDINITGGEGIETRGGDIILTPGSGIDGGTNGSVQINGSGTYTGTWSQVSDEKCKKNINPLKSALKKIDQLRGVEFNWKSDEYPNKNFDSKVHVGLIAQEVEKIAPDLVVTNTDDLKSVEYSKLTVYLVEAMKEQQTMIEELNKKIEQLAKEK